MGHLPRWLEERGDVRLGTVTPPSTSSLSGVVMSGSNGEVNPATVPGGVFTVVVSSSLPRFGSGGKHCNSTCREEKYDVQVRKQALVGGLVGGFMLLFGAGCGIWVVWLWRRKRKRGKEGENGGTGGDGGSGGYVMQDVGEVGAKTEREGSEEEERGRGRANILEDT